MIHENNLNATYKNLPKTGIENYFLKILNIKMLNLI